MNANDLDHSLSRIAIELIESKMPYESSLVERIRLRMSAGQLNVSDIKDQRDIRALVELLISPRGYIEATGGKLPMSLWANLLTDTAAQLKAAYPDISW